MSGFAQSENELSQMMYLQAGGPFARVLIEKRKKGELESGYVYREYPKMLRISKGVQETERETETIKGQMIRWTEKREVFEDIIVHNETEEERVLAGGKTSAQLEQERQDLILRAKQFGLKVDPTWTSVRLRRELGDKLDAPEPKDEFAALQEKLERLQEMEAMRARIAELEAKLNPQPEEVPVMPPLKGRNKLD